MKRKVDSFNTFQIGNKRPKKLVMHQNSLFYVLWEFQFGPNNKVYHDKICEGYKAAS